MNLSNPLKPVIIVAGTRPEAIKLAPVHQALLASAKIKPIFLSTGQQRDLLRQTLKVFNITPEIDLDLMSPAQTAADFVPRAIQALADVFRKTAPAAVLVQGDTNTVLSAALASTYERIPVGHVEAGLRTYDMDSPWPEEINRRLTAPLCRWNFAPTSVNEANLLSERIEPARIFVTGNTVIDALGWITRRAEHRGLDPIEMAGRIQVSERFARDYFVEGAPWLLLTCHRRETFGKPLRDICQAVLEIVSRHPGVGVVYPVHPNPSVRETVHELLADHPRIALSEPADYEDFLWLQSHCKFVLTDSGGVQEEAPSLGKPVLVLRETTERTEAIDAGTCELVGTDPGTIVAAADRLLADPAEFARRSALQNPYGDGHSAQRIAEILEASLA